MLIILLEKANLYGISDAELLTTDELAEELDYVSLSKEGRRQAHKQQGMAKSITRVVMPDPVYIPVRKRGCIV